MAGFKLPVMPPAVVAAMKEDIAAYRTDIGTGETNMDFETWLRTQRPERYRIYLEGTGGRGS
jgi:predicted DNA-binding protein (UPF0278 family)